MIFAIWEGFRVVEVGWTSVVSALLVVFRPSNVALCWLEETYTDGQENCWERNAGYFHGAGKKENIFVRDKKRDNEKSVKELLPPTTNCLACRDYGVHYFSTKSFLILQCRNVDYIP